MQKRALVTGGSGDIGQAICYALAQAGIEVIVHSHANQEKANRVVNEIIKQGGQAMPVHFDVTDSKQTKIALEKILEDGGVIQILVNNAGICNDAIFATMNYNQWQQVLDVNLNGFFNVTQALMLPMMQSRWGRIINMSSVAAIKGNRFQVNYATTKSGLIGATKSLALELASRGITVNAIAPGIIEGSMTKGLFSKAQIKEIVPMQRLGKPEEVAALVKFLSSDSAAYISGETININGAMT